MRSSRLSLSADPAQRVCCLGAGCRLFVVKQVDPASQRSAEIAWASIVHMRLRNTPTSVLRLRLITGNGNSIPAIVKATRIRTAAGRLRATRAVDQSAQLRGRFESPVY